MTVIGIWCRVGVYGIAVRLHLSFTMSQHLQKIWVLLLLTVATAGFAEEVYVACVDCYGSSAVYAQEAKKLFPGKDIRWIHIQTEKQIQAEYQGSFEATKHYYEGRTYQFDVDSPAERAKMMTLFREKKVFFAFGGMETGAMQADKMNDLLFKEGLQPERLGNNPETVDLRRRKEAEQKAVGADYGIPTLLSNDLAEIIRFAHQHAPAGVVVKPDASSASDYTSFVEYASPKDGEKELTKTVLGTLGQKNFYGQVIDKVIVQPIIVGPEYVANTIVRNGKVVLVAVWRYEKIDLPGGLHSYFVDVPIELDSPIALELAKIMTGIHQRLEHVNGPGHSELFHSFRKTGNNQWYFGELGARVGGAGMPLVDAQIWGTSHLHLNLLRVLDPARYEAEIATFPRKKKNDAAVVSLIAYGDGEIKKGGTALVNSLPHRYLPAPFYELKDGSAFVRTKDLNSIVGTINFVGPSAKVKSSATRLIQAAANEEIYEYKKGKGPFGRCAFGLMHAMHKRRLNNRLKTIDWPRSD